MMLNISIFFRVYIIISDAIRMLEFILFYQWNVINFFIHQFRNYFYRFKNLFPELKYSQQFQNVKEFKKL